MGFLVRRCPNESCKFAKPTRERFYSKVGSFLCKWNHRKIPRYLCRGCGKKFSTSSFKATYRQKKPYLNTAIFELYSSGTSQRRLAKCLKTDRKTIARKFIWLAEWARREHKKSLGELLQGSTFQFDEMESFEHTRLKPLSIGIAVDAASAKIVALEVGTLNYKGRMAAFALSKYGPRVDTSEEAMLRVLSFIKAQCELKNISTPTLITDGKSSYPKLIKEILPHAIHTAVKTEKISMAQRLFRKGRRNENDPLFVLNFTAAKIRHDLSRMARKVWVTTKKDIFLQAHLDLYLAYVNGYSVPR